MDGMPMAPMKDGRARRGRAPRGALTTALIAVALLAGACGAFSDTTEDTSTVDVDRETFEEGDVEGAIGDQLEVYDLEATVTSVERVSSFSDLDSRGYIVATVEMHNPSSSSIEYNRSDWQLEKPDGTLVNTANVADEPQLQDDNVPEGETITGTLIFTAGEEAGQFAIVFQTASQTPEDPLAVERGVWVFESSPEDAS
jgi:Domain of unknown function (DUF4352)